MKDDKKNISLLGGIDEKYIEEASEYSAKREKDGRREELRRRRFRVIGRLAGLAAAILVAVSLGALGRLIVGDIREDKVEASRPQGASPVVTGGCGGAGGFLEGAEPNAGNEDRDTGESDRTDSLSDEWDQDHTPENSPLSSSDAVGQDSMEQDYTDTDSETSE